MLLPGQYCANETDMNDTLSKSIFQIILFLQQIDPKSGEIFNV